MNIDEYYDRVYDMTVEAMRTKWDPLLPPPRRPRNADIGEPKRIIRSIPKPQPAKTPEPVKVPEPEKVPA